MKRPGAALLSIAAAVATGLVAAATFALATAPGAAAAPVAGSTSPASESAAVEPHLDHIERLSDKRWNVHVYSAAMERVIQLQVLRPADDSAPRPTLYLLNGAGAGVDGANWIKQTDIVDFFADKSVNVVFPIGGYAAYYTDWRSSDPKLGRNMWQTFLTQELPPVLDAALDANGVNAIGGLSMSATSVLDLAIQAPGLYRGVASYSGCAMTSDPVGQSVIRAVVEAGGKGNTRNMWGAPNDPEWAAHDPYLNAAKLRGLELYISTASGLPGPYEQPTVARAPGAPPLLDQIAVGGAIEAVTNYCTHQLADRLRSLDIPATFDFRPSGTHSWLYWQDALHESWPVLAKALGVSA
ncbi:alpha/beta hydrolase [Aldersonia kunmingensis]|uniref:alpha/beta hydrolase n=1 Tax=Aldersonia kunmingensis TaxID=408066 RepID=UPI000833C758|nr:alpha/beta hydrolase family protein [Aldersonia kunmingensis]